MGQVTNGLDKIEIADIGGSNWQTLGYTNIDSATAVEEDGTVTDFPVEETDTPVFTRTIPGKLLINFQVADPDLTTYERTFGGNVVGVGSAAVWHAPAARLQREVQLRITPKIGYIFYFAKVTLVPKFNAALGKNNLAMIDIECTVLTPGSGAPWTVGGTVSADGSGAKQDQTITFEALSSKDVNDPDFALVATASSGLGVTFLSTNPAVISINGTTASINGIGTADIIATQMGDSQYNAATPVVRAQVVTS
jgi:hypothetical protein